MSQWSILRAAGIGAVIGFVYIVATSGGPGRVLIETLAAGVGGAIAGAVVGALIAGVRNRWLAR